MAEYYSGERGYNFGMLNSSPMMYGTKPYGSTAYRQAVNVPLNQRVKVRTEAVFDVQLVSSVKNRVDSKYDIGSYRGVKSVIYGQYDVGSWKRVRTNVASIYDIIMPENPTQPGDPSNTNTDFKEVSQQSIPDFREA